MGAFRTLCHGKLNQRMRRVRTHGGGWLCIGYTWKIILYRICVRNDQIILSLCVLLLNIWCCSMRNKYNHIAIMIGIVLKHSPKLAQRLRRNEEFESPICPAPHLFRTNLIDFGCFCWDSLGSLHRKNIPLQRLFPSWYDCSIAVKWLNQLWFSCV